MSTVRTSTSKPSMGALSSSVILTVQFGNGVPNLYTVGGLILKAILMSCSWTTLKEEGVGGRGTSVWVAVPHIR